MEKETKAQLANTSETLHQVNQQYSASIRGAIEKALSHTRAPATIEAYYGEIARFMTWCKTNQLHPNPARSETVAGYIAQLSEQRYSKSTISRALTVIRLIHNDTDPTDSRLVKEVWRGIRRSDRRKKKRARVITVSDLQLMCRPLKRENNPRAVRDRAFLCVGWAGALRSSELVALNWCDIEHILQDELQFIIATVQTSKTDQEGKGAIVGLPQFRPEYAEICPVRALNDLFSMRVNFVEDSAVFHSSYFGKDRNKLDPYSRANRRAVHRAVQRAANMAKIPQKYSSHSLRRGLATEAAREGIGDRSIMRHGRWKSRAVVDTYIEEGTLWQENPLMNWMT